MISSCCFFFGSFLNFSFSPGKYRDIDGTNLDNVALARKRLVRNGKMETREWWKVGTQQADDSFNAMFFCDYLRATAHAADPSVGPFGSRVGAWTENATQPSPDTPKTATPRPWTQNSQTPPKSGRKPSKKLSPAACRSDKSETPKGEETGPSTWTENATQPSPDTPKTATSRRWIQNSQTPPKSGRKPSKKPSPAACRSDKSETPKGEPSTWTENATQPSPDTPKTATSRRWTQNSQTPPKSGRKPSKKPSPAACRSDKSETPKGEPSTWTENATQPGPDTPKTATSRRWTQNSQTPPKSGRKPSKKPSPAACRSDKSETHKGRNRPQHVDRKRNAT